MDQNRRRNQLILVQLFQHKLYQMDRLRLVQSRLLLFLVQRHQCEVLLQDELVVEDALVYHLKLKKVQYLSSIINFIYYF